VNIDPLRCQFSRKMRLMLRFGLTRVSEGQRTTWTQAGVFNREQRLDMIHSAALCPGALVMG